MKSFTKTFCSFCLLLLVGMAFTACSSKSHGPGFDPRAEAGQTDGGDLTEVQMGSFQSIRAEKAVPAGLLHPPKDFYKLGPGDIILIEVLGGNAQGTPHTVGPDGKIYYSLLPGTFVWGLSLAQTKQLLEKSLKMYIEGDPQVAVTLQAVASQTVWIMGNVNLPGVQTLATPITLLEAIANAGGVITSGTEDLADLGDSYVMRNGEILPVDFQRLLRHGDLSQNIYLHPNDLVHLRASVSRDVYVLGAVASPNIVGFSDSMSLVSAMASAGGPIPYAHVTSVAIIRGSLSDPKIAAVNYQAILKGKEPNVRLQPGDIVYVPFSPYRKLLQFGEEVLRQFVTTLALNEGQNTVLDSPDPVGVSVGGATVIAP